jgi:hypothetical protein
VTSAAWAAAAATAGDEARRIVLELLPIGPLMRVNPAFSAQKFAAGHAFKDADKRRLFGEHLVLAGLPE